eukprot:gnl/Dysnectes_brevis/2180_a2539_3184.p1 GENE.gnl/Dysnectes_brevis/2180_a2539_3184~~gnl/Dysnectes_brevis/2180_a2539_3184.p1  ORF type:complete len:156 (-),score=4.81 gnl/Dysnectes_brevis/2180_a2539_3184:44-511(-)
MPPKRFVHPRSREVQYVVHKAIRKTNIKVAKQQRRSDKRQILFPMIKWFQNVTKTNPEKLAWEQAEYISICAQFVRESYSLSTDPSRTIKDRIERQRSETILKEVLAGRVAMPDIRSKKVVKQLRRWDGSGPAASNIGKAMVPVKLTPEDLGFKK